MIQIQEKLVQTLAEMGLTIATAESCTGGMIASSIIDVPGASDVYSEGFVTYSEDAKMKYLNVKQETLDINSAVSLETVKEMAKGCKTQTGCDISVATTGVAGPGGGTVDKPVGYVCIGCAYKDIVVAKEFRFEGERYMIRRQATSEAMKMVLELLENQ